MDKLTPAQVCENLTTAIRNGKLDEAIKWKDKIIEMNLKVEIYLLDSGPMPVVQGKKSKGRNITPDSSSDDGKKKKDKKRKNVNSSDEDDDDDKNKKKKVPKRLQVRMTAKMMLKRRR